jgi:hypothetical protein
VTKQPGVERKSEVGREMRTAPLETELARRGTFHYIGFICGLFNNVVALNDSVINEYIGKYVEGSGRGPLYGTILAFTEEITKTSVRIANLRANI